MDIKKHIVFILLFSLISCLPNNQLDNQPNVVFILADDLGYGEIGILGQKKIETPNIDQLAKNGMILTDHYTGSHLFVHLPELYCLLDFILEIIQLEVMMSGKKEVMFGALKQCLIIQNWRDRDHCLIL